MSTWDELMREARGDSYSAPQQSNTGVKQQPESDFDRLMREAQALKTPSVAQPSASQSSQPKLSGEELYKERKAKEDSAKQNYWKNFWNYIGTGLANAQQGQFGASTPHTQQLEMAQQQQAALAGMKEAKAAGEEARKATEWDGRQALINELQQIETEAGFADSPEQAAAINERRAAVTEKLRAGDIAAGNGARTYSTPDWFEKVLSGAGHNIGSAGVNLWSNINKLTEGYALAQARAEDRRSEAMFGSSSGFEKSMADYLQSAEHDERYAKLDATADRLGEDAQKALQMAKEGKGFWGQVAVDATENVLEMGFDMAVGTLAGSPLVPMFARVYGQSVGEARQAGASLGQQTAYALTKASIEVATEKMFDVFGVLGGGTMEGKVEKLVGKLAQSDLGRTFLRMFINAQGEGLEEIVSGFFEPVAKLILDPKFQGWDVSDIAYSYFIGTLIGLAGESTQVMTGQNRAKNTELKFNDFLTSAASRYTGESTDASRITVDNAKKIADGTRTEVDQSMDMLQNKRTPEQVAAESKLAQILSKQGKNAEASQQAAGEQIPSGDIQTPPATQNAPTGNPDALNSGVPSVEASEPAQAQPTAPQLTPEQSQDLPDIVQVLLRPVSNSTAESFINDPAARAVLEALGVDLSGTKSQQRAAIKEVGKQLQSKTGQIFETVAQLIPGLRNVQATELDSKAGKAQPVLQSEGADGIIEAEAQDDGDVPFTFGEEAKDAGKQNDYVEEGELERFAVEQFAEFGKRIGEPEPGVHRGDEDASGGRGEERSGNKAGEKRVQTKPRYRRTTEADVVNKIKKLGGEGWHFTRKVSAEQQALSDAAAKHGALVLFASAPEGKLGVSSGNIIVIDSGLSPAETARVFAHEFSHNRIKEKLYRAFGSENWKNLGEGAKPFRAALSKYQDSAVFNAVSELFAEQIRLNADFFARQFGGSSYAAISQQFKGVVDNRLTEELFCDVVGNYSEDYTRYGVNEEEFNAFRNDCIKAAVDLDIFTPEELSAIGIDFSTLGPQKSSYAPDEKTAKPSEESARPSPQELERENEQERFQETRYNDKHGFDGSNGWQEQQKANEEREAREEEQQSPEAKREAARQDLGAELQDKLFELADKLDGIKLAVDQTKEKKVGGGKEVEDVYPFDKERVDAVRKALRGIAEGTHTFEDLVEAYEGLKGKNRTPSDFYYDENVAEIMEATLEALELVKVTTQSAPDSNQMRRYREKLETTADMLVHSFERLDSKVPLMREGATEIASSAPFLKRGTAGALRALGRMFNAMQTRPELMFRFMGGFNEKMSKVMYGLANQVDSSTARKINSHMEAESCFAKPAGMKGFDDFIRGKSKGNVDIGRFGKVSMNTELAILLTLETNGAIDHAAKYGFELPIESEYYKGQNNNGFGDRSGYANKVVLDRAVLGKLRADIKADVMADPVAKATYESAREAMKILGGHINEVSRILLGIDLATQGENYWALNIAGNGNQLELLNDTFRGLDDMSILQQRAGNTGALRIVPFAEAMSSYIDRASDYIGFAELSSDLELMSKPFGSEDTMLGAIQQNYGSKYVEWMRTYARVLNNQEHKTNKWLGGLRSNLARSSLLLNGSVALKQAPSYWDAAGIIDMDILAKNWRPLKTAKSFSSNDVVRKVDELTNFLKSRAVGYNAVEQGEATQAGRSLGGKIERFLPNWLTNWINKTDYRTVANLAIACHEQSLRNNPELKANSEEHYKATAELFERAVLHTQPIYNKQYRAEYMRSENEVARMFAMFRTQQTQNLNNMIGAIGEYQAAKKMGDADMIKAKTHQLKQTIAGQITATAMFSVLSTAAKLALHKKDKYEDEDGNISFAKILKRFGLDFLETSCATVWFGNELAAAGVDVVSRIYRNATTPEGEKKDYTKEFYGLSDNVVSMISDVGTGVISFFQNPGLKSAKSLVDAIAQSFGIPLPNAYNLVNTVVMYSLDAAGKNPDSYDDFIKMMDDYSKLTDSQRASKTADRAMDYYAKHDFAQASALLSTIDVDDKESKIKASVKSAYISGKISKEAATTALTEYAGVDKDKVDDTLRDWKVDAEYAEAKKADPKKYEAIDALLKKTGLSWSDVDELKRPEMYLEARVGLTDALKAEDYKELDKLLQQGGLYSALPKDAKEKLDKSNLTSRVDDMSEALGYGISTKRWTEAYSKYKEIGDLDLTASQKASRFYLWMRSAGFNEKQQALLESQLGYYSMVRGSTDRIKELTDDGLSDKAAEKIFLAIGSLEPLPDHTSVIQQQKVEAIIASDLTEEEKWIALKSYTSESFYNKAIVAKSRGYTLEQFAKSYYG